MISDYFSCRIVLCFEESVYSKSCNEFREWSISDSCIQRLIHMCPSGASQPKVVYKEPLFVDEHQFLMNVFIREATIEGNTGSECTRL